jgi:hypothetical protein
VSEVTTGWGDDDIQQAYAERLAIMTQDGTDDAREVLERTAHLDVTLCLCRAGLSYEIAARRVAFVVGMDL